MQKEEIAERLVLFGYADLADNERVLNAFTDMFDSQELQSIIDDIGLISDMHAPIDDFSLWRMISMRWANERKIYNAVTDD